MEELQSTEILDREILEDARKKAHTILKNADITIKKKEVEWNEKTAQTIDELEKKYNLALKQAKDKMETALPLEKRRARAKNYELLLKSAVENWYANLNRQRVIEIIQHELKKRLAECENIIAGNETGSIRVLIHKIKKTEAETILKTTIPGISCKIEEIHSSSAYPELILETPKIKLYASMNKTVEHILNTKREELAFALFGKDELTEIQEESFC